MQRRQKKVVTQQRGHKFSSFHSRAIPAFDFVRQSEQTVNTSLEEELLENEWRFRALFEQAAVGIAFTALDGRLLQVNQRFCDIVGYPREDLLHRTFQEITYPDDLEENEEYVRRIIAGEIPTFSLEKRYIRSDGRLVWVNLTVSLMREPSNSPKYLISVVEDITQRKQVEEERVLLLDREQQARAEAEQATRKVEALLQITDTALTYLGLEELLHEMLARVREIMEVDNVAILLTTPDNRYLRMRAVLGPEAAVASQVRVPVGQGFAGRIAANAAPLIIEDASKADIVTTLLREKLCSLLGVPLLLEKRVIGVIHIGTATPRRFTQDDVQLLQRVADRVSLAIAQSRLYEAEQKSSNEAAEHAKQLEAIIEFMADGVLICDSDGELIRVNKVARELLGFEEQQELLSTSLEQRGLRLGARHEHGDVLSQERWPMSRILRGEVLQGTSTQDVIVQLPDGGDRYLNVSGAPIHDEQGHIIGGVLLLRDVTERREVEHRTNESLAALLAIAEELVHIPDSEERSEEPATDPLFAIKRVARRLVELTCSVIGCRRVGLMILEPETEIMRAVAVYGLTPEQEKQWWNEMEQQQSSLKDSPLPELVNVLRSNEVLLIDMTQPPFNEQPNPYGITKALYVPMVLGNQLMGLLSLDYGGLDHEYTDQEIALAKAIAKLTALVIERERLLFERAEARANELALRESHRRMDEFLGIVSHELRTPLTTIKGNVQLAKRQLRYLHDGSTSSEELASRVEMVSGLLERADNQVGFLNRLVGDLLDVSRIQANMLELQIQPLPCDLISIVQEAIESMRRVSPRRSISLKNVPSHPVMILADAERIKQVVINYLTNALKFSPVSSPVTVFFTVGEKVVRVSVHDQGPGLPLEEQERIWAQFYKAPGIEVKSGSSVGLGLGLHICRTIIERHNGQVGIESVPGEGATFWFTLPLARKSTV
jgi:PAS domain S-box-containing protein